jgi:hypothetical protein
MCNCSLVALMEARMCTEFYSYRDALTGRPGRYDVDGSRELTHESSAQRRSSTIRERLPLATQN